MDSLFGSLRRNSRKSHASEPEKTSIGILTFEVATLMTKVVNLWQCLSDKQILRLREEITSSPGIRKLVSDADNYLTNLVLAEIIENFGCVAESVARLGKRCADPLYHHLEHIFDDFVGRDLNWCGWEYKLNKMERKVKKMERFAAVTAQLYEELEVLAELEQNLRRMRASVGLKQVKVLEFQQKIMWQHQQVKNLREMSPWIRMYDYTVRLLLRSLFTILERIKHVFGVNQVLAVKGSNYTRSVTTNCFLRSHSTSSLAQSVHPSDNQSRLYSGSLGRSVSNLGTSTIRKRPNNNLQTSFPASILCGKHPQAKSRRLAHVGQFKGCMMGGSESPVTQSCMPSSNISLKSSVFQKDINGKKDTNTAPISCSDIIHTKSTPFNSKKKVLTAPLFTLGDAALALHYANVIILIEKLASSPYLISLDAREDLYNMLPASVRTALNAQLKLFLKTLASSVYDATLIGEWNLTMANILHWLAPLARNTIRWHSERNFEKQRIVSGTAVLLVQTLYFANQEKAEAAITELLMGLSYISRFTRKFNNKDFQESSCSRACDDYLVNKDSFSHVVVDHAS